jgi:hypothetical protein
MKLPGSFFSSVLALGLVGAMSGCDREAQELASKVSPRLLDWVPNTRFSNYFEGNSSKDIQFFEFAGSSFMHDDKIGVRVTEPAQIDEILRTLREAKRRRFQDQDEIEDSALKLFIRLKMSDGTTKDLAGLDLRYARNKYGPDVHSMLWRYSAFAPHLHGFEKHASVPERSLYRDRVMLKKLDEIDWRGVRQVVCSGVAFGKTVTIDAELNRRSASTATEVVFALASSGSEQDVYPVQNPDSTIEIIGVDGAKVTVPFKFATVKQDFGYELSLAIESVRRAVDSGQLEPPKTSGIPK